MRGKAQATLALEQARSVKLTTSKRRRVAEPQFRVLATGALSCLRWRRSCRWRAAAARHNVPVKQVQQAAIAAYHAAKVQAHE